MVAPCQAGDPAPKSSSQRCDLLLGHDVPLLLADGLVSEGEFLDITEIKRQQAEDYECITNNGVAPPDQRKVKVTVNCKYPSKSPAASYFSAAARRTSATAAG